MSSETFHCDPQGSTPSRQRRASQPEASLAGVMATSLWKRRQQVPKPRISLEIFLLLEPSLSSERGQHRRDRPMAMGSSVRPGSWSGAEVGDGSPGNLRDPAHAHVRASRHLGQSAEQVPRLGSVLHRSGSAMRRARTPEGSRGARKRTNKRPGLREREVVAPS